MPGRAGSEFSKCTLVTRSATAMEAWSGLRAVAVFKRIRRIRMGICPCLHCRLSSRPLTSLRAWSPVVLQQQVTRRNAKGRTAPMPRLFRHRLIARRPLLRRSVKEKGAPTPRRSRQTLTRPSLRSRLPRRRSRPRHPPSLLWPQTRPSPRR